MDKFYNIIKSSLKVKMDLAIPGLYIIVGSPKSGKTHACEYIRNIKIKSIIRML